MAEAGSTHCEHCGTPLGATPPHAPPICGKCLLQGLIRDSQHRLSEARQAVAMDSSQEPSPSSPDAPTVASQTGPQIPSPEEVQKLFPELKIQELLGAGGMGAVYKAEQPRLERLVALKILTGKLASDSEFVARFESEAKNMARLDHPNIVTVYDFGEREDFFFLLMEHVDGGDLHELNRSGQLHQTAVLEIIPQLCSAIQYAHEEGIVHRDIKPANILVTRKGQVKVADFGLAKLVGGSSDVGLTMTGTAMGTPFYMAPEQLIDTASVDQRADIYSLGVVIYQMLTGKLPTGKFPPPSQAKPELNSDVDDAVMRALAQDPNLRFNEVKEMLDALERVRANPGSSPSSSRDDSRFSGPASPVDRTSPTRKAPLPAIAATLAMAAAATGIFFWKPWAGKRPGIQDSESSLTSQSQANSASAEKPFVNGLGMKFLPVPITGGPTDGKQVRFSIWETRVKDYRAFAEATNRDWPKAEFDQGEDHPAIKVNSEDAEAFCEWLTKEERAAGRIGPYDTYRLPLDHEWSCAVGLGELEDPDSLPEAKNGAIEVFPWGDEFPPPPGHGNYPGQELALHPEIGKSPMLEYDDGFPWTAPVGSFAPNAHGLYDLGGNVREWCQDWYDPETRERRFLRDSNWMEVNQHCFHSSHRDHRNPGVRAVNLGFRVVLESGDQLANGADIPLPPALAAMKKRGGRFRHWEAENHREKFTGVDYSLAESHSDITSLPGEFVTNPLVWGALRSNGLFLSAGSANPRFHGIQNPKKVAPGFAIHEDGRLEVREPYLSKSVPAAGIKSVRDASMGVKLLACILPNGSVRIFFSDQRIGKWWDDLLPQIEGISDALKIDAAGTGGVVLKADGTAVYWGGSHGKVIPSPIGLGEALVDVVATIFGYAVGLTESGKVIQWGEPGRFNARTVPNDLGTAYAIRADQGVVAAQMADGSWRAWQMRNGNPVERIQQLGPAIDLRFRCLDSGNIEWMEWIEPVAESRSAETPASSMNARGGRLRAWTDTDAVSIDLSEAQALDDLVAVDMNDAGRGEWGALRANGEMVGTGQRSGSLVELGWNRAWTLDEVLEQLPDGTEARDVSWGFGWVMVLTGQNRILLFGHTEEFAKPELARWKEVKSKMELLTDVVAIDSKMLTGIALTSQGEVICCNLSLNAPAFTLVPNEVDDIVEISCGTSNFLVRSRSGKVWNWNRDGSLFAMPDFPGPAVRIRAHQGVGTCSTAQMQNGTWMVWAHTEDTYDANRKPVFAKIRSLGPVIDLYVYRPAKARADVLLWIEPASP